MPFSQQHGHGGDAQSSQTVAQLYDQITAQYSDVPPTTGQLSDALKHKLAGEGLLDIEVLLRYRSIRTLRALESMDTNEKSLMLSQTYLLYDLLGVFPSSLNKNIETALRRRATAVHAPGQPMGHTRSADRPP